MNVSAGIVQDRSRVAMAAAVASMFAWSIGNVIVKSIDMPGVQIAFWRVVMATLVYLVIIRLAGRRITLTHLRLAAPPAIALAGDITMFFMALQSTTVANATVITALQPLVLLFVAVRRFGERITALVVGSGIVSLGGVALVVFGSSFDTSWSLKGDLLAGASTFFFAAYFALAKRARTEVPILEFQTAMWIVGLIVLAPISLIQARGIFVPASGDWGWLALLVLIPGTGHLLMNWAHNRVRLVASSMLTLSVPVLSSVAAMVFLGESNSIWQWTGMAIVLASLALVIKRETDVRYPSSAPTQ